MYNPDLTNTHISASFQRLLQISGSGYVLDGTGSLVDLKIGGDFYVDGTIYASSSVIYESGSTKFGDSPDDTHQFTGSVDITGSLSVNGVEIDETYIRRVSLITMGT